MKEKVVSDEEIDKFIKFYEETKSDKSNKKIKSNPKQQNANKIIEGGRPQQEETGV